MRGLKLEISIYRFVIIGVFSDIFSTLWAMTLYPLIYEGNPFVRSLMASGFWLPVDLLLVGFLIFLTHIFYKINSPEAKDMIFLPIFFYGCMRLYFGFHNVGLILAILLKLG